RLEVVDVGAVPVHLFTDGMAGPVDEMVAVSRGPDDLAARLVHFPSRRQVPGRRAGANELQGGIARPTHDAEDLSLARRNGPADEAGPGDVAVDAARFRPLAPEVDQDEVPRAYLERALGGR